VSIIKIDIENYKSIKKCSINMNELNLIIGENGCGKTNIISALKYFYDNLIARKDNDTSIFDRNNKFSNEIKIGITYSFKEFKKIYQNQMNKGKKEYQKYYQKILSIANWKDELYVELKKIKEIPIKWNIQSVEKRQMIYNIFPFYFADVRDLNLVKWDDLWLKIGDLVKVEEETSENIRKNILNIIDNDYENTYKLHRKFDILTRALNNANIGINKYSPKQFGASLAKTYFEGERFIYSEEELSYFSSGTNSFNYINLLIEITNAIRIKKIKFPTIIIDEPELGLHHKFIDMLTEKILYNTKKIQFILCTHSARMVKNIFKDNTVLSNVINLKYKDKYTTCTKMNNLDENRELTFITDEYVNSYFSKMFLLVEGESELELFNNRYLKELYPMLKSIDILMGAGNEVASKIMLPQNRNYKTNYLIIKDMDKVLKIEKENKSIKNQFSIEKDAFIYSDKERFYYTNKRENTLQVRNRIKAMTKKCKFHYELPFYSCKDTNYYELMKIIKQYFLNYNTFIVRTTTEGLLVNYDNYHIFWRFLKQKKLKNDTTELEQYYETLSTNEKVNFLRLLVNGKTDYLLNLNELDKIPSELKQLIKQNRIGKTKWITEWLEYYFYTTITRNGLYLGEDYDFKREIAYEQGLQNVRSSFYYNFKELTVLINYIYKKYYN